MKFSEMPYSRPDLEAMKTNLTACTEAFLAAESAQDGLASVVVPIDKLSILVSIAFSAVVFHERLSKKAALGLVLIVVGTLMMIF